MASYRVVVGEDWTGIYVDGKLVREGHSIEDIAVLRIVQQHGPVDDCAMIHACVFIDDIGGCPINLSDVKEDE